MANGYAKERYAFGRPIGSFQGIKHKLSDMYIQVDVETPKNLTRKQRELLEEFEKLGDVSSGGLAGEYRCTTHASLPPVEAHSYAP